MQIAENNLIIN